VYGLIQQGRYSMAADLIGSMRNNLAGSGLPAQNTAYVEMRAHYLLHSEEWGGLLDKHRVAYDKMTMSGNVADVFTDGVVAYRRRDSDGIAAAATELSRLVGALQVDRGATDPVTLAARVMARELGGMALFLGGAREQGVRAVREATAIEDAMPMDFGPPAIVEPSHELLGSMLLEMDPGAAVREYQRALQLAPGRTRALIGLTRAAVAIGDKATAQQALDRISQNWRLADPRIRDELIPLRREVGRMP
jgi:hypothetical protein